jgi:uncharacterized protein (TIGR03000 family)
MVNQCIPYLLCASPPSIAREIVCNTGAAKFTVSVPQDAILFVNGKLTTSTGSHRVFASVGLKYGTEYGYVVRVQILRDGKIVEQARKVVIRPDESKSLTFEFPVSNDTRLTSIHSQ